MSDFINEVGNVFIPGLDASTLLSLTMSPVACVDVYVFEPGTGTVRFPAVDL